MVRPYSLDLRERVVGRVVSGRPVREVAATFDVSVSSVVKWSQRQRATGSPAAKPMGNRRPNKLSGERTWIMARIDEVPDLTLQALLAELRDRGVPASYGSLWRLLRDAGISFKKKPARQRARPP